MGLTALALLFQNRMILISVTRFLEHSPRPSAVSYVAPSYIVMIARQCRVYKKSVIRKLDKEHYFSQ